MEVVDEHPVIDERVGFLYAETNRFTFFDMEIRFHFIISLVHGRTGTFPVVDDAIVHPS